MIRDLLREAAARLDAIGAGNPRLEAEYLLAHALGIERPALLGCDPATAVEPDAEAGFAVLLARRLAREPLQYVLGTVPFAELDLVIGPGALIPRGETEVLVEQVAAALGGEESCGSVREGCRPPLLVDVGTGSGAILLALLHRLPGWRGIGIDRSAEALAWARRNARRAVGSAGAAGSMGSAVRLAHKPSGLPRPEGAELLPREDEPRLRLVRGDLLAAIPTGVVDAVVSNPPYIRSTEISDLAPEIREHEPPEALDGGADGLDPFRRLAPEAARVLRSGGLFAVELAPDQPDQAAAFLAAGGIFRAPRIFLDLAGRKRGLLARRA